MTLDPESWGDGVTSRRDRLGRRGVLIGLAIVIATLLLIGVSLWRQYQAAPTGWFIDSVQRFRADVAELPGVDQVARPSVSGSEVFAPNRALVPIVTDPGLDNGELRVLAEAIATRAELGQTRRVVLFPMLALPGGSSIAIAPHPHSSVNEARLDMAEDVLAVDGVIAVNVLLPLRGDDLVNDDLVNDDSNAPLEVTAHSRSNSEADIIDAVTTIVRRDAPAARITVRNFPPDAPVPSN